MKAKKCDYEGVIGPMALHGAEVLGYEYRIGQAWGMRMLREESECS